MDKLEIAKKEAPAEEEFSALVDEKIGDIVEMISENDSDIVEGIDKNTKWARYSFIYTKQTICEKSAESLFGRSFYKFNRMKGRIDDVPAVFTNAE